MIVRLEEPLAAARWCEEWRASGRTLGFVPTMGALHEGHLGLVRRAREENEGVCASIFVNPLQFDEASDFQRYPRDFEHDAELLESAGCTLAFTGTLAGFFPGQTASNGRLQPGQLVDPGPCAEGLEGALRPGHFAGVATIVQRLFELVAPTRAYFGQKDFQQTLVVRDLAARLGFPPIQVCPTAREASGLARSSRNVFLTPAELEQAATIARALRGAHACWQRGERDPRELARVLREPLERAPFTLQYACVRDPERWTAGDPPALPARAVALVALRLGAVRLIDNWMLSSPDGNA